MEFRPGLLYVWATLMPLLSVVLLPIGGGLRALLRPYRAGRAGRWAWWSLGGDHPGALPGTIATVVSATAFLLSAVGFVWFAADHWDAARSAQSVGHWDDRSTWLQVGWLRSDLGQPATHLDLGYHVDHLTTVLFLMVTFIATLIHLYSIAYLHEEQGAVVVDPDVIDADGRPLERRGRFGRFFVFLSLFTFAMLNLVLADNLLQVFFSWELVGLCSYLLIGFYSERPVAAAAALKAFVVNRIGDAGFLIALAILWSTLGTFQFEEMSAKVRAPLADARGGQLVRGQVSDQGKFTVAPEGSQVLLFPLEGPNDATVPRTMPYGLLVLAGLCLFAGCMGKSAQFPLHTWLPDAMAGPTPVSALIHAATMVAAGVYLAARCDPLFTPEVRLTIAYLGCITLFIGATVAVAMTDIKRLLAWSTVSQLGLMMLSLGVGGWALALLHLLAHAFFKALLFLGAGSIIHACHGEQDLFRMGGLARKLPVTAFTMLAGCLAIAGTPLLSGWHGKDGIIAHALGFVRVHPEHALLLIVPVVGAALTAFYIFRMWYLAFVGKPRIAEVFEPAHESPRLMTVPLLFLAIGSVAIAWGWPLWDSSASALGAHLEQSQPASVVADLGLVVGRDRIWRGGPIKAVEISERHWAQQSHGLGGLLALGAGSLGLGFASIVYAARALDASGSAREFPGLARLLADGYRLDAVNDFLFVRPVRALGSACAWFDRTVLDGIASGLARGTLMAAGWDGRFDRVVVDGLVSGLARLVHGGARALRAVQTGALRQYVLFLMLGVLGLFAVVSYLVTRVLAG